MDYVDMAFRLKGHSLPVDHSYLLFSALNRILPKLHSEKRLSSDKNWEKLAIHPITGKLDGNRMMKLSNKSRLTFRIPSVMIQQLLFLTGQRLNFKEESLQILNPEIKPLSPFATLHSHVVIIKGAMEAESFMNSVLRQLKQLDITAKPGLKLREKNKSFEGNNEIEDISPFVRRTVKIHGANMVGYSVDVTGLSAEDSLKLQVEGIGGKRKFGCGIFVPKGGSCV